MRTVLWRIFTGLALPCAVKADQVTASVKNRVLEVRMPKTEEAKKKTITVTID